MEEKVVYTPYTVVCSTEHEYTPYPYLIAKNGTIPVSCLSPIHCRSILITKNNSGKYVISKGNGLTYTEHVFLYTPDMPTDVLGLLLKEDALRDFHCGQDIQALGIKTNQMECVLELDTLVHIKETNTTLKPILLQYNVECPYRIADAPFMTKQQIYNEISKWATLTSKPYTHYHQIAADILIRNLSIMHSHHVLHNALTCENITWALELLDFELARTPNHPYTKDDYERHVSDLYAREIFDAYRIINYIAGVLGEQVNYKGMDELFHSYGFNIHDYATEKN